LNDEETTEEHKEETNHSNQTQRKILTMTKPVKGLPADLQLNHAPKVDYTIEIVPHQGVTITTWTPDREDTKGRNVSDLASQVVPQVSQQITQPTTGQSYGTKQGPTVGKKK
jgi:hypothetical protein